MIYVQGILDTLMTLGTGQLHGIGIEYWGILVDVIDTMLGLLVQMDF